MTEIALVTGGNRGIGLATALRLRASGHEVVVACRSGRAPEALAAVAMDVANPESIEAGFAKVEADFGPVTILVANAGITRDGLLMRMSDADIDDVLNTNLAGAIRLARRGLPAMLKARGGRIIFISSVVGMLGSAGQVNYAAAKSGLIGAGRSLAREVGSRGITVNVVTPGFVETDMTSGLDAGRKAAIMGAVPLGRYAQADEVAALVQFLASVDAGYITGAVIPIDGGLGMGH
ncbi:MAG: SDR family oxidoreductase [Candidatus Nanopelagicales bacterium]|nr:SDR family oxidoreductase [Candidatus Nanopelagicales bacterium]